jgi:hypothetical protein
MLILGLAYKASGYFSESCKFYPKKKEKSLFMLTQMDYRKKNKTLKHFHKIFFQSSEILKSLGGYVILLVIFISLSFFPCI